MPVVFNQTAPAGMRVPPHVRLFHGATLERLTDADFLDHPHRNLRLRDARVTGEGLKRLSMFSGGQDKRPADRGYNVLAPIRVPLR
jgi:hypothetical protein